MMRRNKALLVLAIIAVALLAARLALPSLLKNYVNERLANLEAYTGRVGDIDIALWRGAYRIEDIRIDKRGKGEADAVPFFTGDRVDFSVEWRNLMRGSLVAQGIFFRPTLNLVQGSDQRQSQLGKEVNWADQLQELFPFRFNTVEVRDGTVTFRAPGIHAKDSLTATRVQGGVSNLTNVATTGKETFAEFRADAAVLGNGSVRVSGSLDPLARQPTFDVNLAVRNVQLPKVNAWLRQYIKADAEAGDFELYLELAAAQGRFKGYAKPVMQNVSIYGTDEKDDSLLRKLWEGVVEFAANLFENQEEDQVAARVPFSGAIDNPEAGIAQTIVSVLRNAFVAAFARSLEGSISLRDVKKNLGKYDTREPGREGARQEKEH